MEQLLPLIFTLVIVAISGVFGLVITAVSLAIPGFILYKLWSGAAEKQRLLTQGVPATAQITAVQQTGMLVNHNPQVRIELEVQPPDGPAYAATVTTVVSLVAIPRVQPGTVVDVRYDPADRTQLAIVGL